MLPCGSHYSPLTLANRQLFIWLYTQRIWTTELFSMALIVRQQSQCLFSLIWLPWSRSRRRSLLLDVRRSNTPSIKWNLTSLASCLSVTPDVSLHYSARRRGYGWDILAVMSSSLPSRHGSLLINEACVMSPGLLSHSPHNRFTVIGEEGLSG